MLYDPSSGWRYGFPKPFRPLPGEHVKDTLIRDGYPVKDAEFAAKYCRYFGGSHEELLTMEVNDGASTDE